MKNKMKFWRKMGNLVTINVPTEMEVVNESGEVEMKMVDVPHTLTGRQLKMYTGRPNEKPPMHPFLKNLMKKAFPAIINTSPTLEGASV